MKQSNRSNYDSRGYDISSGSPLKYRANITRDYFMLYNKSDVAIQIRFGANSTVDDSLDIPPNSFYEPLMVPTNEFTISSSEDARVVIVSSDASSKVD